MSQGNDVVNPFRPGAGLSPPLLAGRTDERRRFSELLQKGLGARNILLTGNPGFGKTVLLDEFRKTAVQEGWLWVGNDISESAALSEGHLAVRVLTDLSHAFARIMSDGGDDAGNAGLSGLDVSSRMDNARTSFDTLSAKYDKAPGLPTDKLMAVFAELSDLMKAANLKGVVFAYDEAQRLVDLPDQQQFPLSMLIETIAGLQKQAGHVPFALVLSGLPQLYDTVMGMRTQAERLFQIYRLSLLNGPEADEAFMRPLQPLMSDMFFSNTLVGKAIALSRGHPFLLQLLGSELVDAVNAGGGELAPDQFPLPRTVERLESEIFNPAWRLTDDSQKRVLTAMAQHYATTQRTIGVKEVGALLPRGAGADTVRVKELLLQLVALGLVFQPQPDQFALMIPLSEKMILARSADAQDAGEEKQLWYRGARVR